ncbi:YidB family protein [Streptomyces sp. NPDC088197]|uniref:YidB family protein n=1 Tax=Streptomyces sp. NPDC088197 TaxID=3365840 RepID=UPI00382E9DA9
MAGNDLGSLLGTLLSGAKGGSSSGGAGGLLGSLLGQLGGKGAAGGTGAAAANGASGNPFEGLLGMLNKSGLGEQARSWVGQGDNKPVTGDQIAQALPDDALRKAAQDAGVSPREAADHLAGSLPEAVDKLTPEGEVPQGESLQDVISRQLGKLGGLGK